ncbi:ABC transporter substrate-binding protein [Qaidamihabitans albus]|uniref:ABC transporter substrate-binding protein n=1 Tax=Qaidamihabitans albus TaxID=2795733 RepID=UPI0018F27761|nr:ABC transporter substrate-binding protein [Qaidamihabitans albus]
MSITRFSRGMVPIGLLALVLSGCSDPVDVSAGNESAAGNEQEMVQELHDRLPAKIRDSGKLVSAQAGQFPPYHYLDANKKDVGSSIQLGEALADILGVDFETVTVQSLPGVLSGIEAGRYDFSIGPIGDFAERQKSVDFVDYIQEFVAFAVQHGNPENIQGLQDICGIRVAVQAGGSAEEVAREQSERCVSEGSPAADVKAFQDQNAAILSVRSGRTDAFFSSQAPLTYFAQQAPDQLEVAAGGQSNGFDDLRQGMVVPKDSELGTVLLEALQRLYENGTYERIMTEAGLETEILPEPGINLGADL